MYRSKKFLGIIAARGGSKRLPRKNIRPLAGRPLIEWTCQAALGSDCIDRVVLSTDDNEIAEVVRSAGVDVPFMRPKELATDSASSHDVVLHTVDQIDPGGTEFDYVVLLQPTSPLRTSASLDAAAKEAVEKDADCLIGMCELDHPTEWATELPENRDISAFLAASLRLPRSQDLPQRYRINGAVYVTRQTALRKFGSLFSPSSAYGFPMAKEESLDIDDEFDFLFAESLLKRRK